MVVYSIIDITLEWHVRGRQTYNAASMYGWWYTYLIVATARIPDNLLPVNKFTATTNYYVLYNVPWYRYLYLYYATRAKVGTNISRNKMVLRSGHVN